MSKWGWKHSAMFAVSVLCATGALVVAGLSDTSRSATLEMISAR